MTESFFWAVTVAALLIEGLCAGSEIALVSVNKIELRKVAKLRGFQGMGARLALWLLERPERVFSTTILVANLCIILVSTVVMVGILGSTVETGSAVVLSSVLIVIFGELIPKSLFQKFADTLAPFSAFVVASAYFLLFPLTRLLSLYTGRVSRWAAPVEVLVTGRKRTTREEIRTALSLGRSELGLRGSEKRMIKRILDFKDSAAKHALIPLVQVDAISDTATVADAWEVFRRHRHSRLPVFHEKLTNIIGIVEVLPLLRARDQEQPIRTFVRPVEYVAEVQTLQDVLFEMEERRVQFMVVVDEHGGAIGILTYEDIVEEIVGEIQDEYDVAPANLKQINENRWWISARVDIERMNEEMRIELPLGEYETLGGFLLHQFGRIPQPGDELVLELRTGPLKFEIERATSRRIESVWVEKIS